MLDKKDLHPYQRAVANFIIKNNKSFVILTMGLGKTAPTLSAIRYLQQDRGYKTALVLAPLRVVYNSWPVEIAKWSHLHDTSFHILHGAGKTWPIKKTDIILSNFDSIPYIIDKGVYKSCEILVIDESSYLKAQKTERFKKLSKIASLFKKVILLTGTPSQSGTLTELFSQVFLLDGGERLGKSFWAFRNKFYFKADFMGYKWDLRPGAREDIQARIKDLCIVLKAKDYLDMPPVIRNTILVDLPAKIKAQYKVMERDFILELQGGVITAANAAVKSGKLRQIAAGAIYHDGGVDYTILHDAKIEALTEIIESTDSNILCCFQFKFERAVLSRAFPHTEFIDGSTSAADSTRIINQWNAGKIKLLCCHPQSVGHGLNLQAGGHVLVWLSPDWSSERTMQMDARIWRQGQAEKVFIHTIAVKDSIDLFVIEALGKKFEGQGSFIDAIKQKTVNKF